MRALAISNPVFDDTDLKGVLSLTFHFIPTGSMVSTRFL